MFVKWATAVAGRGHWREGLVRYLCESFFMLRRATSNSFSMGPSVGLACAMRPARTTQVLFLRVSVRGEIGTE